MTHYKILLQVAAALFLTAAVVLCSETATAVPPCPEPLFDDFTNGTAGWSSRYAVFHPLGFAPRVSQDANGSFLEVRSRKSNLSATASLSNSSQISASFLPKLGIFNSGKWSCNYTASGIVGIKGLFKNLGAENLTVRLVLQNGLTVGPRPRLQDFRPGVTQYSTNTSDTVLVPGQFTELFFPIDAASMKQVDKGSVVQTFAGVRANVSKIFFRHNADLSGGPETLDGDLAIYRVDAVTQSGQ